jgi:hypothetical protein
MERRAHQPVRTGLLARLLSLRALPGSWRANTIYRCSARRADRDSPGRQLRHRNFLAGWPQHRHLHFRILARALSLHRMQYALASLRRFPFALSIHLPMHRLKRWVPASENPTLRKSRTLDIPGGSFYSAWQIATAILQSKPHARVAELADALDLGSSGQPWGFESPLSHHACYHLNSPVERSADASQPEAN